MKYMQSAMFRRVLRSYFFLLLIPIVIFCGVMLRESRRQQREDAVRASHERGEALAQSLDGKFSEIDSLASRISQTTWLKKLSSGSEVFSREFDHFRRREISDELSAYNSSIRVTWATALYLPQTGQIIDATSWWESDRYLNKQGITDPEERASLLDMPEDTVYHMYAPSGGGEGLDNDFTLQRNLNMSIQDRAIMLFLVDGRELWKYCSGGGEDTLDSFAIFQDGAPIFSSSRSSAEEEASLYQCAIPSRHYNWEYRVRVRMAQGGSWTFALVSAASILPALAIGGVLAYFFARASYRPLGRLLGHIGVGAERQQDEYGMIEEQFKALRQEKDSMEQFSRQYFNAARSNAIVNLLWGLFDPAEIEAVLERFSLPFRDGDAFQVYLIRYRADAGDNRRMMAGLHIRRLLEENGIRHVFADVLGPSSAVLLSYAERPEALESRIVARCLDISLEKVGEYCPGSEEIGLGGIHLSYERAKEKMDAPGQGGILPEEPRYFYPIDWQVQLVNYIRAGNRKSSLNIVRSLFAENQKRQLEREEQDRITTLVFETLYRIGKEMELDAGEIPAEFQRIMRSADVGWQWDFLSGFVEALCSRTCFFGGEGSSRTGREIIRYVEENCCDSTLSLQKIADRFGLSPSSISKIFKSSYKINYIEFLHLLRVEKARAMFDGGNADVIAVARATGYESESTFKRAFLRLTGLTPRKYVSSLGEGAQKADDFAEK